MMLLKDYNVLAVPVVDESTLLNVTNSINTLVGLNKIAKQRSAALSLLVLNNSISGVTTPKYEKEVNATIKTWLSLFSMFTSGYMRDIDHQDMSNFIIPTRYKTFSVAPGIYMLGSKTGVVDDPNTILVRTAVTDKNNVYDISVPVLHNKVGYPSNEHVDVFTEKAFPVYITLRKNVINDIVVNLQKRHEELEKKKK
jgi:hypothetical protein